MIIDNRLFMNEDEEILVTCLAREVKRLGGSRQHWEKRVDRTAPADVLRLVDMALDLAFQNEAAA